MIKWLCPHKESSTIFEIRGNGQVRLICSDCYLSDDMAWPDYVVMPHSTGKSNGIYEKFLKFHGKKKCQKNQ